MNICTRGSVCVRAWVCVCADVGVCVCRYECAGVCRCVCAGVCAGVYVGMQRPHVPAPLPAAGNPLRGLRALTFLASALGPSLPGGGSVDTVKSLGSSQSRILDSFIRESSFLLAMFSTRFRLVEACESQPIIGLRPPPRAAVWTASGVSAGPAPPPSHLALTTGSLLHHCAGPHRPLLPLGCTVGVQFVLGPRQARPI